MFFREALSPVHHLQSQIERAEKEKQEAEFRTELAQARLRDFQQQVATLLPKAIEGNKNEKLQYPLRQMASVVVGQKDFGIERASTLLERGKEAFRKQEFERSGEIFSDLIAKYPDSVHITEAYFLLAEGQFQLKDYEAAVATIDKLVLAYPENELTGFALLRLGRIFELQERLEDAGDIYKAVLGNFNQPSLKKQASLSLKGVQL
jgi:TolA-binding protein